MKAVRILVAVGLLCVLLVGCAGPNQLVKTANAQGKVAGFWLGL